MCLRLEHFGHVQMTPSRSTVTSTVAFSIAGELSWPTLLLILPPNCSSMPRGYGARDRCLLAGRLPTPHRYNIVEGKVSSFTDLTLGMGMGMEATGWQNIISRCVFLGLTFAGAKALAPFDW